MASSRCVIDDMIEIMSSSGQTLYLSGMKHLFSLVGAGPVRLLAEQHLQMEAVEFQKGNFADPSHLHGSEMPGLREMQQGAPRMQITYRALPNGAEIRFWSNDIKLITAVHRWFGAQLSEHGADAHAE